MNKVEILTNLDEAIAALRSKTPPRKLAEFDRIAQSVKADVAEYDGPWLEETHRHIFASFMVPPFDDDMTEAEWDEYSSALENGRFEHWGW